MSWLWNKGRKEEEEESEIERMKEREREVVYLALLVTLLWLLSSSHALDFLKLLHHRPLCQSWLLIGWEELPVAPRAAQQRFIGQAAGVQEI